MAIKTTKTSTMHISLVSAVEVDGQTVATVTTNASNRPYESPQTIKQFCNMELYKANREAVKADITAVEAMHEAECFNLPEPIVTTSSPEEPEAEELGGDKV